MRRELEQHWSRAGPPAEAPGRVAPGRRGAAGDRLLSYLLDGARPDPGDEVAGDLVGWLSASARFLAFVDAHRDKIRKKLRGASESAARGDVRAELETAFALLA